MSQPLALTGFSVGISADRRWDEQAALFERRGAAVVHGPSIRTLPLGEENTLRRVTESLVAAPPEVLVANTGLGIRSWFSTADAWGLGEALRAALSETRIYARGRKASGAVHSAGLAVHARAESERLNEAVDLVLAETLPGARVAVQVDGSGGSTELERLRSKGLEVVSLPVYRWTLPADHEPALRLADAIIAGVVHAVTFTSGPAVRNLMALATEQGVEGTLRGALTDGSTVVGCVGPVCAAVAEGEGLASPHLVQPDTYRIGPLVRAVAERLSDRRVRLQTASATLILSGAAVLVGDDSISLSGTEARLLSTLAARQGSVTTKEALLRSVWGAEATDTHAVEVGIARLRKRLGPHGDLIRSVHRRGYTLLP